MEVLDHQAFEVNLALLVWTDLLDHKEIKELQDTKVHLDLLVYLE